MKAKSRLHSADVAESAILPPAAPPSTAPIARERPAWWHFVLLAALFLALGAGAIAQVLYEVGRLIARQSREEGAPLLSPATFGGLAAGVLIMYATALLVAA